MRCVCLLTVRLAAGVLDRLEATAGVHMTVQKKQKYSKTSGPTLPGSGNRK